LIESTAFTVEEERDLRALLLGMREEDRSGLYQRAYNYLEAFRVGEEDLDALRKRRELEEQARRRQSKKVARPKVKRGPPAEPVVKSVPASSVSASSVSKVLFGTTRSHCGAGDSSDSSSQGCCFIDVFVRVSEFGERS
jgi:hypothetical protein